MNNSDPHETTVNRTPIRYEPPPKAYDTMIASLRRAFLGPGMLRDSASVGIGMTLVKAAGAVKIVFMARAFGASDALDAYLMAFLLPSFASEIVVGSLSNALIPALISLRERRGREEMERSRANLLTALVVALAVVAALLLAASPLVLRLIASDFGSSKLHLTQGLFMLLLPLLPLSGVSTVWRAALNAEERFTPAALAPVTTPAVAIALLWIGGPSVTVWMLAIAHVVGLILELACLAVAMAKNGLGLMPQWSGWDAEMRTVLFQHLPLVAVAIAGNGGILVDQSMAATLASGSVSALNYGTKLATVTAGVVGGALSTAALPRFSKMAAAEDWIAVRRTLAKYAKLIMLVVVPATALLIAGSDVIVRLVFQRGALTESVASLVVSIQRWSLLQVPPAVFAAILLRVISSFQANQLLMRVALLGLILNTALDFAFKQQMGLSGIALSSSVVQFVSAAYVLLLIKNVVPISR
ncbi:MAG TPA: lipid II flippase MurJ [Bryobacteraceae bacterium]